MAVITSLSMIAGTPAHVTIGDAAAGNAPLPNSQITWENLGVGVGLTIASDPAGGFVFGATSPGSGTAVATWSNGIVTVRMPALPITVGAAVMPIYLSP